MRTRFVIAVACVVFATLLAGSTANTQGETKRRLNSAKTARRAGSSVGKVAGTIVTLQLALLPARTMPFRS